MINKIKNLPLITKVLYVITLLLFIVWVLPTINSYFANMSKYDKNIQELEQVSSKYGIAMNTQKFTQELFKRQATPLFSKVEIEELSTKIYRIKINMKREELQKFHTFIETLALKYYVQIEENLAFKAQDDTIAVAFKLKAL